jgi:phosphoribosylglycinamide formyltransferase-1
MSEPLRVGVLASGRGSNFRALAEAAAAGRVPAAIVVLICDRPGAPVLDIARAHGVDAVLLDGKQQPSREAHEKAVIAALEERRVGLVCLAGYMRLLTVHFVDGGTDTGPIVLQAAVPVRPDDTETTLSERILVEEHRLYPEAVRLFAEGRLEIRGRQVHIRESS